VVGVAESSMSIYTFETATCTPVDLIDSKFSKGSDTEPDVISLVATREISGTDIVNAVNRAVNGSTALLSHDEMLDLGVLIIFPNRGDACPAMNRFVIIEIGHHYNQKNPLFVHKRQCKLY
jgi:hypothetical protein